jgi:hypothetical protein
MKFTVRLNPHCIGFYEEDRWMLRRISWVALVPNLSWWHTNLGNSDAKALGSEYMPLEDQEFCSMVVPLIERAVNKTHESKMWDYTGKAAGL